MTFVLGKVTVECISSGAEPFIYFIIQAVNFKNNKPL